MSEAVSADAQTAELLDVQRIGETKVLFEKVAVYRN